MNMFDFGAFQEKNVYAPSRAKYTLHMLFGSFHGTYCIEA